MLIHEIRETIAHVFFDGYTFHVEEGPTPSYLLKATYMESDVNTGEMSRQTTRKWFISQYATRGEVVQTLLKCILTSMEHRAREGFLYKGVRVFGPHMDIEALTEFVRANQEQHR